MGDKNQKASAAQDDLSGNTRLSIFCLSVFILCLLLCTWLSTLYMGDITSLRVRFRGLSSRLRSGIPPRLTRSLTTFYTIRGPLLLGCSLVTSCSGRGCTVTFKVFLQEQAHLPSQWRRPGKNIKKTFISTL